MQPLTTKYGTQSFHTLLETRPNINKYSCKTKLDTSVKTRLYDHANAITLVSFDRWPLVWPDGLDLDLDSDDLCFSDDLRFSDLFRSEDLLFSNVDLPSRVP